MPIRMLPRTLKCCRAVIVSTPAKKISDGGSAMEVFSVIRLFSTAMMPPFFRPTSAMKRPIPPTMAILSEGLSERSIICRSFVNEIIRKRMPEISTTPIVVCQTTGSPSFPPVTAAQAAMTLNMTKKFVPIPGASPIG